VKKILALTTINNTISLKEAIERIRQEYGSIAEVKKIYFDDYENPDVSLRPIEDEVNSADVILVDIRGDIRVGRALPHMLEGKDKTVVVLIAGSQHVFALTKMGKFNGGAIFKPEKEKEFDVEAYIKTKRFSEIAKKLGKIVPFGMIKDMRNWVLSQEYYAEGDSENLKNLILFLLKNYAGIGGIKVPPPKRQLDYGLYLPGIGIIEDFGEYKRRIRYDDKKPTVGVLLYGHMHFDDTRPIADALYECLKNDVNIIFVSARVEYNVEAIGKYLREIDLFLNLQYFRIHGGPYGGDPEPTHKFFQDVDVPYIIGLRSYETEIEKWKEGKHGINPLEVALGITLPELDGGIEPIFVAGLNSIDDPIMGKIKKIEVLEDGIKRLGERIKKWLSLRAKPNGEKKIAIVTYNYPPGEDNLASAGYLDVFESMGRFLVKLRERGYHAPQINLDLNLGDLFISSGVVNSPNYIQKSGIKIPANKYISWFRSLPKSVQEGVIDHWGEPPGDIMTEGQDILVPGIILGNIFLGVQPSRGVHEDIYKAYHDKELPPHHQYLAYYFFLEKEFDADAVIHFGMHGTLEFTKGKEVALSSECFPDVLIGSMPNIYYYWVGNTSESTIAKRRSYALCISHASPPMKSSGLYEKYVVLEDLLNQYEGDEKTQDIIRESARDLHLPLELNDLRRELYRLKRRLIPYGLHVIDRIPTKEELVDYMLGVLRVDREFPSILKLLAKEKSIDWERAKDTRMGDEIETEAKKIIKDLLNGGRPKWLPEAYADFARGIADKAQESTECDNLLRALEGRYIQPARGGDPIRDPDVYPSGRAMYAFDPRLVPTVAAEARGKKSASLLIDSYLKKYGECPESVGIVLWGFETMKTGGDTIATILSLIGVRIRHRKSLWFKELEVIPLEELTRPRIDVVVTICGIFRDLFGTHMDLINRAIEMVTELDEAPEKNFVRKHYLETKDELGDFALARIFGPSPTEYGTSMRTLVESSSWNDEGELVASYDDSMNYAYLRSGVKKGERAFSTALKSIDIVTQERDNTEYEVTDLDHYYEFLGGLSRSVQDKKGEKVDVLVTDSTEEDVMVDDLKTSIERATRARTLNPRWIEGMLNHDFHGAKEIKDRVENLLGFAATTGEVENWLFDEVADRLIFDEEMRKRLQLNNPYAAVKMCELLMESKRRGYWKVEEEKLKKLRDAILDIEGEVE